MYEYHAKLVRVLDGDSLELQLHLGFHITISQICRLQGVNCPETRGLTKAAGTAAKKFTTSWLPATGESLIIKSFKDYADDKFGRFLVVVTKVDGGETLNDALIQAGHALPFMVK